MTWWTLIHHWDTVQADLQRLYGISEWREQGTPWPFMRAIILDLITNPDSRTHDLFVN